MSAVPDPKPAPKPAPRTLYAFAVQQRQCFLDIANLLRDMKQEAKKGAKRGAK